MRWPANCERHPETPSGVGRKVLKNKQDVTQEIGDLIRLHDDVLARVFALQTLLQDLGVLSPEDVQRRAEKLRKQFALDLEARLVAEESRSQNWQPGRE
jgi:hypothetical protein